jgi:hypothetical protein
VFAPIGVHREIFPGTGFRISTYPSGFLEVPVKRILVSAALLLALAGCGTDTPDPEPTGTLHADMAKVSQRWKNLTEDEKKDVCTAATSVATPSPVEEEDGGSEQIPYTGPNYKAMLKVLMDTGLDQPQAAAMLPYAANKCF